MRYSEAHAARSGSVPFALRGPKPVRMALAAAVAGAIGLVPAVAVSTPAFADFSSDVSITPASSPGTEGDSLTYTVKYTGSGDLNLDLSVVGAGDNPVSSGDYTLSPSTLKFTAAGNKTVTVKTVDDSMYELTEGFTLKATDHSDSDNVVTASGTIYDNDVEPSYTLSASPATVTEGKTPDGFVTSKITATLSAKSGVPTKIVLSTDDGTAKAGDDYTAVDGGDAGTILIPAGSLSGSTTLDEDNPVALVKVLNDLTKDTQDTENFKVDGQADNASPDQASTMVNIVDAQTMPVLKLTANHDSAAEDTTDPDDVIKYTVTSSVASELPITVRWDAVPAAPVQGHDAATAGQDFTYPSSRTVKIAPGATSVDFWVVLRTDGLNENPEDYGVQIAAPTNAIIDDKASQVTSTIIDADTEAAPDVTIAPAAVPEGNAGKSTKTFTATLTKKSGRTVTVDWATRIPELDSIPAATPGKDYVAKKGTLVFPPGVISQTFTVDVIGDIVSEGDEAFYIGLDSPDDSAVISDDNNPTQITITDDDPPPTLTFDGTVVKEGEATTPVMLQAKLSNPSTQPIRINIDDVTGSGAGDASGTFSENIAGSGDYTLLSGQTDESGQAYITIPAGQTTGYVAMLINGDTIFEGDETASIKATVDGDSAEFVSDKTQTETADVKILNDDKPPTLMIDNIDANEGDSAAVTGTVQGMSDSDTNFNITFTGGSAKGSTAADAKDFVNPGTMPATIPAGSGDGDTVSIGNVSIVDDPDKEGPETILVNGTPAAGSMGTVVPGTITIAASDGGATPPPVTPTLVVPANVVGAVAVPISGKAAAGADVELWGAPTSATKPALVKLMTTKANASGAYSFSRWIGQGYRFSVKVGDWTSPEKSVTVTQNPVFVATTTKGSVTFAVQGNPRGAGQAVIVQSWVNGAWKNVWKGTTAASNQWKSTVSVKSGTALAVRAFVVGFTPDGIAGGYSAVKRFTVK